jgi:hypothetical protein
MSSKNFDDIFEKEDKKEYINDDITLTETKDMLIKKKIQTIKKNIYINFEK